MDRSSIIGTSTIPTSSNFPGLRSSRAKATTRYTVRMTRTHNTRHFPVIVEQDEAGLFVATNPALPGCYSQGTSMEKALANVREATEASLAAGNDGDVAIPNISVHVIAL